MIMLRNDIKLVIFDVDGTILDTSEGIISSAQYAIKQFSEKMPNEMTFKTYIGPPIQESFERTLNVNKKRANEMAECFRERYKNNDLLKAAPYEGILDVFKVLSNNNIKLAIATYKRQDYAEIIVNHFGFSKYTSLIFGSDYAGKLRKADIIHNAIESAQIKDYNNVVMIGDTYNDALGADALGISFIGVTYGFGYQSSKDVKGNNVVGIAVKPLDILRILMEDK